MLSTLLIQAGRLSHVNLVNGLACQQVGRASDRQSELAGVRILTGDSDYFLCPTLTTNEFLKHLSLFKHVISSVTKVNNNIIYWYDYL